MNIYNRSLLLLTVLSFTGFIPVYGENDSIGRKPNIVLMLVDDSGLMDFVALEPTTVLSMDYEKLDVLVAKHPQLEANRKLIYHAGIKEMIKRNSSFILLSPEERYLDFVQKKPELVNRVPDKYIAHVLGITPVSLSRIRRRIANKKKNKG